MAKKKIVHKSPRTQAPRNRKQTPPKKKGQLVKPKGKPGPLAPAAHFAHQTTRQRIFQESASGVDVATTARVPEVLSDAEAFV